MSGLLRRVAVTTTAMALVMALVIVPAASAATVLGSWSAKVGTGGSNGTAMIQLFDTGTGSVSLKLTRLKASSLMPVVLSKGTCASAGAAVVKLSAIKTSRTGTAARTTTLTVAQANAIRGATKGSARIAIRIGSGSSTRCGVFTVLIAPPYLARTITVGRAPSGVAIDPTGIWVTNWSDNSLTRIDPITNSALSVVPITLSGGGGPESIASSAGSLWLTTTDFDASGAALPGSVMRVDPVSGTVIAAVAIGAGAYDITVGLDGVWIPEFNENAVVRIDPATNQIVATIPMAGAPSGIATDASSAWVVSGDGTVNRIDAATNLVVAPIHTRATGGYIAVGAGAVWVTNPGTLGQPDGTLSRINPTTNQVVASVPLGRGPQELVVAGGSVWVGMYNESTVVRVSATTNAVLGRITMPAAVYSIDANAHSVWAVHNLPAPDSTSSTPAGSVSRINY